MKARLRKRQPEFILAERGLKNTRMYFLIKVNERVNLIYSNLRENGNMIEIPLEQIPNQIFEIILNQQDCTIHLYVRGDYLYLDLEIANTPFFYGAICLDRTPVLPVQKETFNGNFLFIDTLGKQHPEYTKLNDRYKLYYLSHEELNELQQKGY